MLYFWANWRNRAMDKLINWLKEDSLLLDEEIELVG